MSAYLIQASPLTRIFLPEWHDKCLADPTLLMSTKPFRVLIPRPCGAIELVHGQPVLATSLLPRSEDRVKSIEDEVSPLVQWLTDDQVGETDGYGVVAVPIQENVADAIMTLLYEKNVNHQQKLLDETRTRIAQGIQISREKADARVMRACSKIYSVVKSTVEEMKKNNKGHYSPSYAESLALQVMKDQIKIRKAPEERAAAMMSQVLDHLEQPV